MRNYTPKSLYAELKNTFCLTRGDYAFLSHHIGDLENYETLVAFEEGVTHMERLFRVRPEALAYDLHPDYLATRYALERAAREELPAVGVQHHHAHIAAPHLLPRGDGDLGQNETDYSDRFITFEGKETEGDNVGINRAILQTSELAAAGQRSFLQGMDVAVFTAVDPDASSLGDAQQEILIDLGDHDAQWDISFEDSPEIPANTPIYLRLSDPSDWDDDIGQPVEGGLAQGLVIHLLHLAQAGPGEEGGAARRGVKEAMEISAEDLAIGADGALWAPVQIDGGFGQGGTLGDAGMDFVASDGCTSRGIPIQRQPAPDVA